MRKKEKEALSMALSPQEQILQSYENWFALNALYDKWAKAHGLTSNGLMTLYAIRIFPCCTQRTICEALALPKQTVNTILDGMQKKGYIRLDVLPTDRRSKRICLTPQGEEMCIRDIHPAIRFLQAGQHHPHRRCGAVHEGSC